ncbi:hypothetical protein [Pectinatus brassicae]|uniref:Uncharacterized protein n=1 Tax=Pectinatus brassicae TaxID=862415 RepID=A0A840UJY2_9FIRM|nr:hypothetical protein [Pectinatus brassicae]MBB5337309.1 hypothetical protein [Pectinatus brassicae]
MVVPKARVISCENDECLFVSNFKNNISVGGYLTIFYMENSFERFYGIAQVTNIQPNCIQTKLYKSENNDTIDLCVENIVIKPIVTPEAISVIMELFYN